MSEANKETKRVVAAPAPAPVVAEKSAPPVAVWQPMADAPRDGTYCYLRGDPNVNGEWYFYKTRHYNGGYWQETGWWRQRFGPNSDKLPFEPKGFRRVRDGLPT